MSDKEKVLSDYIDSLNAEKMPKEHEHGADSPELEELMKTVRMVRSLKEPAVPSSDYGKKISKGVIERMAKKNENKKPRRNLLIGIASVAAVFLMAVIFNLTMNLSPGDMVYAMEEAFKEVKAYHGTIEIIQTNEEGQEVTQNIREVWADKKGNYYIKEIEGSQKGLITVNNGQHKWQIRPDSKKMYLFAAFPDPYRFTFELGKEIQDVKNAINTKLIGEEKVSGRETYVYEVSPQGGESYKLWVDKETKLPLKKQSAMQNAIQYTITYTDIEFIDAIPAELMAYEVPEGFGEIKTNTEQYVNNLEEAEEAAGIDVKLPADIPAGYKLDSITVDLDAKIVKLYYTDKNEQNTVVVLQGKAADEFKPASTAVLGQVKGNQAEIQSPVEGDFGILAGGWTYAGMTDISSIRWQEDGFEYAVVGDTAFEDLVLFVKGIAQGDVQIPSINDKLSSKPQVEVLVDLKVEENEQKSVDAGHSPWKLDPIYTAQVFVSLQISPEGIQGDYPVQYEDFKVEQNTGAEAVLTLNSDKTDISKVYLKKLIRQDSTGIWTVVGYDTEK